MKKFNNLTLCALLSSALLSGINAPNIFHDVRTGNKEAIKKRLENCEDCSEKDSNGNNVLHIAVEEGDAEIVDLLTTPLSYDAWTDWFYAFIYAPTLPNINEKNNDGDTPLHGTVNNNKKELTKLLLKKDANVNIVNKENLSALFAAIKKDAPQFIPIFVAHKLDLNKHRCNGETILHYAIKEKKQNSIHYCVQETSLINASNNKDQTPVLLAIETENFDLLHLLHKGLNIPASNGVKPIHYATRKGKIDVVNYLLEHNIAIDEPDKNGNSALFYAITDNNIDMVNYLLSRGASLNKRNNAGEDVFSIASRNKDPRIAQFLAHMPGIDIDARDNKGQTSFMRLSLARDYEGMKRLINLGVNIRITDNKQENVLHKIARNGDHKAAQIALNHDNLLLNDHNKEGLTPLSLAVQHREHHDLIVLLLTQKANIHAEDNNGFTALHHASAHDNVDAIIMLLNHGASSGKRTKNGSTAAHTAAAKGSINALRYWNEHNPHLLRTRNSNHETPLLVATKNGNRHAVELLLCNADFVNQDIDEAIHLANEHSHYDTARFLQQKKNDRNNECQDIVNIRTATLNLITENNSSFALIEQKNHRLTYIPVSLNYYSKDQLYNMSPSERDDIKRVYLDGQARELNAKTIFLQAANNIRLEKQAAERAAAAQALANAPQAHHVVQFQGQDSVISLPAGQVYPPQEEDDANAEQAASKECCICYEENPQLLQRIPCKNHHSDHICGACLKAPSVKTCPICRGPITKQ